MKQIYVAFNGDDVGSKIGQSIASDDHESLSQTREAVKRGNDLITQWAQSHGGKEVVSSGDECIYLLPVEAARDIENIRSKYSKISGHTLTAGIGSSMSEAAKALLYGKINGKDQLVEYNPSIDQQISEAAGEEQEQASQEPAEGEEENTVSGNRIVEQEQEEAEPVVTEEEPAQEEQEEAEPSIIEEEPAEEEQEVEVPVVENNEEAPVETNQADEEGDVDLTANKESEGQDEEDGLYHEIHELSDVEEMPNEENDLTNRIHSHMSEEDENTEDSGLPNSEDESETSLREDIANALEIFKQNKSTLESAQEQNPELYTALITMLRSMIVMGKKLGYSVNSEGQQGSEDQSGQDKKKIPFTPQQTIGTKLSRTPTKSTSRKRVPVGTVRNNRVKTVNPSTGQTEWKKLSNSQKSIGETEFKTPSHKPHTGKV